AAGLAADGRRREPYGRGPGRLPVRRTLRPVADAPALVLDGKGTRTTRALVVADLHLGLAGTSARPMGPPRGSAGEMEDRLVALARAERAGTIVIAGDVKHPIVGTPLPLRPLLFDFFSALLGEGLRVEVVLGNHDAGLERHLPREVEVHPATGAARRGVGIFHGHRWPSDELLGCRRWVTGHLHPGYRFAPTEDMPDGKRPCWIRVEFPTRLPAVEGRVRPFVRELVVLPPFNPLAGLEALNRERPARGRSFLYRQFLARGIARAYLLDGTDLGVVPMPTGAPHHRPRAGRATSRGR
ncbi:MAG: metallophosphoesterase, partial [Thermoplasmata archaeon]